MHSARSLELELEFAGKVAMLDSALEVSIESYRLRNVGSPSAVQTTSDVEPTVGIEDTRCLSIDLFTSSKNVWKRYRKILSVVVEQHFVDTVSHFRRQVHEAKLVVLVELS